MGSYIMTGTLDFSNAEWFDVGHVLCASCFGAAWGIIAHFVAPTVPDRAIATGCVSNQKAF